MSNINQLRFLEKPDGSRILQVAKQVDFYNSDDQTTFSSIEWGRCAISKGDE